MLDTKARKYIDKPIIYISTQLHKKKIKPNTLTYLALVIGLLSSITYCCELPIIFSLSLLWLSGLLDVLDGSLARLDKSQSNYGAFLDIIFDRIVEISIVIVLVLRNNDLSLLALILLSSILISMCIFLLMATFTKNESSKSFTYQTGLAERSEGFIMFSLMFIFTQYQSIIMIIFITMICITIIQRYLEASKYLKSR